MFVDDIEINEIPINETPERARASVSFMSYERQVQVMCDLHEAPEPSSMKRRVALMRDALRQLRRMPEFRAGRAALEFRTGLIPDEAQG